MSFYITIYGLGEDDSFKLWEKHKTDKIHCLAFDGKTYICGEATKDAVAAIITDIKDLGKEYGIVSEELM